MRHYTKDISAILTEHKTFVYTVLVVLFLSLIRIPLGTFNSNSSIDTISHFALPAFAAPLFYVFLRHFAYLPNLTKPLIVWFILLVGISAETVWEIFEFGIDSYFGTHWQVSNADTMHDLMLSVVGSLVGGLLYAKVYSPFFADRDSDKHHTAGPKKLTHSKS